MSAIQSLIQNSEIRTDEEINQSENTSFFSESNDTPKIGIKFEDLTDTEEREEANPLSKSYKVGADLLTKLMGFCFSNLLPFAYRLAIGAESLDLTVNEKKELALSKEESNNIRDAFTDVLEYYDVMSDLSPALVLGITLAATAYTKVEKLSEIMEKKSLEKQNEKLRHKIEALTEVVERLDNAVKEKAEAEKIDLAEIQADIKQEKALAPVKKLTKATTAKPTTKKTATPGAAPKRRGAPTKAEREKKTLEKLEKISKGVEQNE